MTNKQSISIQTLLTDNWQFILMISAIVSSYMSVWGSIVELQYDVKNLGKLSERVENLEKRAYSNDVINRENELNIQRCLQQLEK